MGVPRLGAVVTAVARLVRRAGEDVLELHRHYAATGDPVTQRLLVDQYAAYAASLARRLHRGREPIEDLVQVAMEGLLMALRRFDPERGVPFTGFAAPTIIGTLRRFYRDSGYAIQVPRAVHDLAGPARDTADRLAQELGRPATVPEVADAMGITEERLLTALSALEARSPASLDAPVAGSDESLAALVGRRDPELGRAEDRVALAQGMALLSQRDRQVLRRYFQDERTQTDIADEFGVSQVQVSRWLASAVRRLRGRIVG